MKTEPLKVLSPEMTKEFWEMVGAGTFDEWLKTNKVKWEASFVEVGTITIFDDSEVKDV